MLRLAKNTAKAVLPRPILSAVTAAYGAAKLRRARKVLARPRAAAPEYLPADMLSALMRRGYNEPGRVRYDADGLVERATEKIAAMSRVVDLGSVGSALELGCWDGMVGAALARRGVRVCGLDVVSTGFDRRARNAHVRFLVSDAEAIALADASLDLVFTFASFEHFPHPDRVMREIHRVLRPGGTLYLSFGPLYNSPYGRHAYRQVPIPFCHLLFDEASLRQWTRAEGLPDAWPYVNGWSLAQYRHLWKTVTPSHFTALSYVEHTTGGVGAELVSEFPSCFAGRVSDVEELVVSAIDVVLRKT